MTKQIPQVFKTNSKLSRRDETSEKFSLLPFVAYW